MRKEQLQRYARYLALYLRHATFGKLVNAARVESRLLMNNPDMAGLLPYFLFVEISNTCNLHCPLCQTGRGEGVPRENRMTFENYRRLIEPLAPYLFQVFLYDWGEPFLNRDIYRIIGLNSQRNIGTVVSTNFNLPIDAAQCVECGLEHLIISGDGITQEVYERYRKGGRIEKVFGNLHALVAAKKKAGSRTPRIEWQCLVTRHNERQLDEIRETVLQAGADEVRFGNLNFYSAGVQPALQEEWLPRNPLYRKLAMPASALDVTRKRRPCFWLWRTAIVNVNGGVTPCCLYDIPDWGNALDDGFPLSWNNALYREARLRSKIDPARRTQTIVCDRCTAKFIYR
jgi:MoaA/NifB/PqqE/SkfB family radical SAM enzyme